MIHAVAKEFYQAHKEYLAVWHPGLNPWVLEQNWEGLSELALQEVQGKLLQGVALGLCRGYALFLSS